MPGRQHRDRRHCRARRRGAQAARLLRQPARIVRDRLHLHPREQLGEHRHHRLAVLEHVADARRRAGVVLEHEELVGPGAHQVDADDMGVDPARRGEADHLRQPGAVVAEQPLGQAARADDLLPVVEIVHEGVERAHPLLDPARQPPPFAAGDDPRDHVERDQPLLGVVVAIDVEGDAGAAEEALGLGALAPHPARCPARTATARSRDRPSRTAPSGACISSNWAEVWRASWSPLLMQLHNDTLGASRQAAACGCSRSAGCQPRSSSRSTARDRLGANWRSRCACSAGPPRGRARPGGRRRCAAR